MATSPTASVDASALDEYLDSDDEFRDSSDWHAVTLGDEPTATPTRWAGLFRVFQSGAESSPRASMTAWQSLVLAEESPSDESLSHGDYLDGAVRAAASVFSAAHGTLSESPPGATSEAPALMMQGL